MWLQCHFVRELFSYLSLQIISNASANCFNVSIFSKQHDSFSANLHQLSVSTVRSYRLESLLLSRFAGPASCTRGFSSDKMGRARFNICLSYKRLGGAESLNHANSDKTLSREGMEGMRVFAGCLRCVLHTPGRVFTNVNETFSAEVNISLHWMLHYP